MTGQSVCQECDPGYLCSEGSTSARPSSDKCSKGYYCPDGLTETACPEGRSSPYYYIFSKAETFHLGPICIYFLDIQLKLNKSS